MNQQTETVTLEEAKAEDAAQDAAAAAADAPEQKQKRKRNADAAPRVIKPPQRADGITTQAWNIFASLTAQGIHDTKQMVAAAVERAGVKEATARGHLSLYRRHNGLTAPRPAKKAVEAAAA